MLKLKWLFLAVLLLSACGSVVESNEEVDVIDIGEEIKGGHWVGIGLYEDGEVNEEKPCNRRLVTGYEFKNSDTVYSHYSLMDQHYQLKQLDDKEFDLIIDTVFEYDGQYIDENTLLLEKASEEVEPVCYMERQ